MNLSALPADWTLTGAQGTTRQSPQVEGAARNDIVAPQRVITLQEARAELERRAAERAHTIKLELVKRYVTNGIQTEAELADFVWLAFQARLPDTRVCEHHTTPWRAFADAYFARVPVTVIEGSRGLSGKSYALAMLGLTMALTIIGEDGAHPDVNILGGSGEQSRRVLGYMANWWNLSYMPRWALKSDPAMRETKFVWGNTIQALMASQTSVRGPHPQKLLGDEIDEMELDILDAALGQPMARYGIATTVVLSCFTPETPITMADGTIRAISEIKSGDVLLGPRGAHQTVTALHSREHNGPIYKVVPAGLPPFRVTSEHMLVTPKGELPVVDAVGAGLVSPKRHMTGSEHTFMAGWLVGLYLAEGNLRYPKTCRKDGKQHRSYEVTYSLHQNETDEVARIVEAWARQRYPTKKRGIAARVYLDTRGASASVRVTSRGLHGLIARWVEGRASDTKRLKRLPTSARFAEGLLRGWMAGDGTNYSFSQSLDQAIPIQAIGTTTSQELAWQFTQIATDLGHNVSLKKYKPFGLGIKDPWSVNIRPTFDPRTAKKKRGGRGNAISGITRRAKSSTEAYSGRVYDLTVEPSHLYIAGGILCHNSTHHNAQGTMTTVKKRAAEKNWANLAYCYRETLKPHGWLEPTDIETKRINMTAASFRNEVELQEPAPGSRAIQTEKVDALFRAELGVFEGRADEYIEIEPPMTGAYYATGADWAKENDWTIIVTLRVDVFPARLVAFERRGRVDWPMMVKRLDERSVRYGTNTDKHRRAHDGTGLGDVIDDYLGYESEGFQMRGLARSDLLSNYIKAIEEGEMEAPQIEYMYAEHKMASVADVYQTGDKHHLPDTIAAGALAWYAARQLVVDNRQAGAQSV